MEKRNRSSGQKGTLSVIGSGPGSLVYITPAARKAIAAADIVIGYKTYLELIASLISGKVVESSAMMQETDRVKKAIRLAEDGHKVALISGGDPGVYAMAGLVFETAKVLDSDIEIQIRSGIAALNACAERLGLSNQLALFNPGPVT